MEKARAGGNHNAVMGFTRIKMQAHGALKDNVSLTVEQRATDEQLIKAAAGDDPVLEAALRKQLGAPDSFDDDTRHRRAQRGSSDRLTRLAIVDNASACKSCNESAFAKRASSPARRGADSPARSSK